MKQLLLDIWLNQAPTLENFVTGDNEELLASLAMLAKRSPKLPSPHLYLWGNASTGRSHLLRATVARAVELRRPAIYLPAAEITEDLPRRPNALIAIDDVDKLSPIRQTALFNAYNRANIHGQSLLVSGPSTPRILNLRADLQTRIAQGLIFEVHSLDDKARADILRSLAARSGLTLSPEVIGYLLTHGRRDLPSLMSTYTALNTASLEHKRPITLPLLRELMKNGLII